ncbi:MAG: hypothetical protein US95_C0004G0012 [Candidatus Woesebacteria bacterium GW2011_GWB1_38_5]|uniref:Uncharacterized protein n=4 Tax=Candidatus Woeseibacteriota TaxID=1752722 RepID=A0A0G0KYQ7_9BACT|nr:MAG: hypothetical protein US67_C0059G0005 [Candidatus Woesebacteria bacterium GW2011_GWD1_38_10]KKQ56210.1 MAG: hypothetical protein US75_C0008G0005 [Candidatus Woesebacteria bacterium GW2011_GWC1_38_13]KKQ75439.1 MAG: hypothetical protein US95_C0004G0012 [Candidatus Woesebacteria bacterium GW2011_GWB1_38_5]KKQ75920.1 MAG: hypothetical protein US97_C0029G0004 [Microgenomates group bacterium GW2011_GWF1_38_5]KKQ84803.1 MAG: hypothetical protein UT06_C0001G0068 [Candidatus Woesebacteria bacter
MEKYKGKLYLIVFVSSALFLGVGIWNNYRPQIVYASCADIAEKTTNLIQKKDIYKIDTEKTFDEALVDCLSESGYYE